MLKRKSIYIIAIAIMMFLSSFVGVYAEGMVGVYPPQPKDVTVLVTKPTISWQFILDGTKIKSAEMLLNNEKVDVKYDEAQNIVYYNPPEPLKPGNHKVNLSVALDGVEKPLLQTWEFTISENASDELRSATDEQNQALVYSNLYRKFLGLKHFKMNNSLNASATAHSNYMAVNKTLTSDELASKNGFTETTVYGRAGVFGYSGSYVDENVSYGQKVYKKAIDSLFASPYHRIMWMNPFFVDFGYGSKDKYYTVNVGGIRLGEDKMVVYPMDKQEYLPAAWEGDEKANPLKIHGKKGTVGYPITLSYFSEQMITEFNITKTSLTDSKGSNISTFTNTPDTDKNLKNTIIIIPKKSLDRGEKYTVTVKGNIEFKNKTSVEVDKTWTFTTAPHVFEENTWQNSMLYTDIENHWAKANILELLNKQIVSPKTGTEYRPDDKITRAEFAEFIVKALELESKDYSGTFKDVKKDNDKAVPIESAFREGIIKGVGNGYFMPNKLITREEMAVMIIKAYKKKKGRAVQLMPPLRFSDKGEISSWALNSVRASNHLDIIKGRTTSTFVPKGNATRAEAAVMLKKLLDVL